MARLKKNTENMLKALDIIASLPDNWDNEGAKPFPAEFVRWLKNLVMNLQVDHDAEIFPTMRDSVQFEFDNPNGDYLEFEVSADRKIRKFSVVDGKPSEVVLVDRDDMRKLINVFYGKKVFLSYDERKMLCCFWLCFGVPYCASFGEISDSFRDHIVMQNLMYILQEKGVWDLDYSFYMSGYGMRSAGFEAVLNRLLRKKALVDAFFVKENLDAELGKLGDFPKKVSDLSVGLGIGEKTKPGSPDMERVVGIACLLFVLHRVYHPHFDREKVVDRVTDSVPWLGPSVLDSLLDIGELRL